MPENATNKELQFTSMNESVAKVDMYGQVTILNAGTTIIEVKTTDGSDLRQECVICINTGVDLVFKDGSCVYDIYDSNGVLVKKNADNEYLRRLPSGVYIICQGTKVIKFLRRS